MPELPEVESARKLIEANALDRPIVGVGAVDSYECRPHRPSEIREALLGRRLLSANRRGKSMWCTTSGVGRSSQHGPDLGLHLGMGGRLVITDADGATTQDSTAGRGGNHRSTWDRLVLVFSDGTSLRLVDKRRLGRIRLDPDIDALGPDAMDVDLRQFREILSHGSAPVKARLLDQARIAGVGNLLADEALWRAHIRPDRRVTQLSAHEVGVLHRSLRSATRSALSKGGVHTGQVIEFRKAGAHCPRCGAPMVHGTVGGRSTWWCSREQSA